MTKKTTVEIIGTHPSLRIGDKKTLPTRVAKALIGSGMAKLSSEQVNDDVPTFKEETPKAKVTVVKVAEVKVEDVKVEEVKTETITTKSAVKIEHKKGKNKK